jgi:excisionase family DNA binding protein
MLEAHPPTIPPLLLDAPAAARALSVSVRTLHRLVGAGDLRPVYIGRLTRFRFSDLQRFSDTRQQAPEPVKVNARRQAAQPIGAEAGAP